MGNSQTIESQGYWLRTMNTFMMLPFVYIEFAQ